MRRAEKTLKLTLKTKLKQTSYLPESQYFSIPLILKFSLAARPRGHKQRKQMNMFIHFFCLCPLSLAFKLNFNIIKVVYSLITFDVTAVMLVKRTTAESLLEI